MVEEQRALKRVEARQASIWLQHLAEMPEFRGTAAEARMRLALLQASLQSAGAALTLRTAREPEAVGAEMAAVPLALQDGTYELAYTVLPGGKRPLASRTLLIHVGLALLAVVALSVAMLWIVETRLIRPLSAAAHQIHRMKEGGGWETRLGTADGELQPLWSALGDLGPGLARQVEEWIVAERRAAVALALKGLRDAVATPLRDCLATASELQARGLLDDETKRGIRTLVRRQEAALAALNEAAHLEFDPAVAPTGESRPVAPSKPSGLA